jgi:segregation and condensation protein A
LSDARVTAPAHGARGVEAAGAPAVGPYDPDAPLVLTLPGFHGTLGELAHALRTERIAPSDVDLLAVVRLVLARFEAFAVEDLDRATEALPRAAQVVELKVRLLLPRPPRVADDEAEAEAQADALAAVAALEALEEAIVELRERRERRRSLLTAKAPVPDFPRARRPLGVPLGRLAELASRLRPNGYFELVPDRLTLAGAMARLLAAVRPGRRRTLDEVVADASWATLTVTFAGALELVREGRLRAHQDEAFGPIELEGLVVADAGAPALADAPA